MVTRFVNSRSAKSKLGQVTYLKTLTFHSCGFQLMVHTTPNRPYFVYHPIFITTRPISWVTAWTTHPLTVSDFCHLIMQLAYIKANEVLTPWCRVLLEKLTGLLLVKKFPAFYGTRRFITALTSVRHLSLSWARPIQSVYPHPTSRRSILILYEQKYSRYLLRFPSYNLHKFFTITVFLGVTPHSLVDRDEHAASTFTINSDHVNRRPSTCMSSEMPAMRGVFHVLRRTLLSAAQKTGLMVAMMKRQGLWRQRPYAKRRTIPSFFLHGPRKPT